MATVTGSTECSQCGNKAHYSYRYLHHFEIDCLYCGCRNHILHFRSVSRTTEQKDKLKRDGFTLIEWAHNLGVTMYAACKDIQGHGVYHYENNIRFFDQQPTREELEKLQIDPMIEFLTIWSEEEKELKVIKGEKPEFRWW
jgi:hypothetical protein